ncbi:MAG: helix-turn-helix domain-containing protein [Crocinitomicaceae bacterium]|nr:helix-turn-helix domain-containing protein [Crocinitomicaceae bacterium]
MNFKNIQLLIELIEQKNTGNPAALAKKLAVSERMIYKYLDILKSEFNAPIKYSRKKQSYFFTEEGELNLRWRDTHL